MLQKLRLYDPQAEEDPLLSRYDYLLNHIPVL